MYRYCAVAFLYFTVALSLFASEKTLTLRKTSSSIAIDGIIDNIWNSADSVSDFVQLSPYPGTESAKKTIAKVLTTDDALYCLMICFDDVTNIQQATGNLDDGGGDIVSIMLDTFGDKRTAYKLAVNAAGARADCRLLDDARNRDYNWDGVWFSEASIYDWGFVIEMEIPYRSLQYDKSLNEWGLDFDRWIPSTSEDLYWCAYEKNEGQRISKFGKLVFDDFKPQVSGLNLEIYPVGIAKYSYNLRSDETTREPDAGIDIFYNPSQSLTFQLTANPDFAQIEADPFSFNISRYESYFNERRPFFTQGNEVFMPAGRSRNSGFYKPLELFYSRRIGKKLPDGSEVPLLVGTKAFGRVDDWEYGGFLALTGEKDYDFYGLPLTESQAYFSSARIKKQVLDNSSVGLLYVGKHTAHNDYGVLDIDGAFRSTDWQLAYQLARSFNNNEGDIAASVGFTRSTDSWLTLIRGRHIGTEFDISQIGYVPWRGTTNIVALSGPVFYYDEGILREISTWIGPTMNDERVDDFTDWGIAAGYNMQFRANWGYEFDFSWAKRKDMNIEYTSSSIDFSLWYSVSPKWWGNLWAGFSRTFNFNRGYEAFYTYAGGAAGWKVTPTLDIGTSIDSYIEGNPDNDIEDITLNTRPYISITPVNDFNFRVYVDNVYMQSTDKLESVIFGALFSYSFMPKSWIYLAYNSISERIPEIDPMTNMWERKLRITDRAGVVKIKYLYFL